MARHPPPTYERLRHTIAERMRMSPIDQPLMLMELLGHGFARHSQPSPGAGHHPEKEQRHLADQRRGGEGYEASVYGRSEPQGCRHIRETDQKGVGIDG